MVWCPRCGTSLSQHELTHRLATATSTHPSLFVYLPLADADDEALVVWTTTPWTLPANVAAAVNPDADYVGGRRRRRAGLGRRRGRVEAVFGERHAVVRRGRSGARAGRAGPTTARSTSCRRRRTSSTGSIAWDDVGVDEGTGIVHIAPGCGAEDFELGKREGLPVLVPVDEAGAFYEPVRLAARPAHRAT